MPFKQIDKKTSNFFFFERNMRRFALAALVSGMIVGAYAQATIESNSEGGVLITVDQGQDVVVSKLTAQQTCILLITQHFF